MRCWVSKYDRYLGGLRNWVGCWIRGRICRSCGHFLPTSSSRNEATSPSIAVGPKYGGFHRRGNNREGNRRHQSAGYETLIGCGPIFSAKGALGLCDAVLFALRSGKSREILYSIFLELRYWACCVFHIRSLVQLKPTPFWRCCSEYPLNLADLAATLRLHNFSVVESATRWCITTESSDGIIFGATRSNELISCRQPQQIYSSLISQFSVFSVPGVTGLAAFAKPRHGRPMDRHLRDEPVIVTAASSALW